jgi:hypothetical protein
VSRTIDRELKRRVETCIRRYEQYELFRLT